ncbi:MAG: F0F1 ATP synthase subunit B [Dehalococcoidia bacterium]|nr:F0F1 ATP synthase subunit B [Dehalococcoidia bacterium]
MEALGINLSGLIAQVINIVILLLLLRMVAYKPIMRMLDERTAKIKASMDQAEQVRLEAERAQQEFHAQIEAARKESQNTIAQASQIGDRIKQETLIEAKKEAENLLVRARSEIQLERDRAVTELRREFADLTVLAAEKVINKSLNKEDHKRLIEEVLSESTSLRNN